MSVLQQGATMDSLAATLRLSRKELQSLSVRQYNFLQQLVLNEPDEELMRVVQEHSSDRLQAIANEMGMNIGHSVPVDSIDRLLRRVGFTLQGSTRTSLVGALERERTGVVDLRLFFRLWSFWHANSKTRRFANTAQSSRLLSAANAYPEIVSAVRDMNVIVRELQHECKFEDPASTGRLHDDKFLAVLDRQGIRLSHTQLAYLLMLLESEGFRSNSNVQYDDLFADLAGSNAVTSLSRERPTALSYEMTGQQLFEEVQRRWSYARSLLPLRVVKDDLVDAFKRVGFTLSPMQADELWRILSDAVAMQANSKTETFLDKSELDHVLSARLGPDRSEVDLPSRSKTISRANPRHQQNLSENVFAFAKEQPRPQPRPLSAMRPQVGRVRSSHDPTDLFGGRVDPPNVFLRVKKQLQLASDHELHRLREAFHEYGGVHGIASAASVCDAMRLIDLFLTSANADDMIHWVQEHRPLDRKHEPVSFHELISASTQDERILAILEQPFERAPSAPHTSRTARLPDDATTDHGIRRVRGSYRQDSSRAMSDLLTRSEEYERMPAPQQSTQEPLHQRHQQQIFPPTQDCDRTYALQHLQLERPLLAMLMRSVQYTDTTLDKRGLVDVFLHPRLQLTTYLPEAEIHKLASDIIAFTNSQSHNSGNRVDFSNVMTYISHCLNLGQCDERAEMPNPTDAHLQEAVYQKLRQSSIIQGEPDRLLGMHSRLLQRLVDLRSRGHRGVERELQGAELLTVASIMECLYAVDMSLSRDEATWLWKQALRLDSSEPGRQRQPVSTHEQTQAVTLSSVITVLLTLLTSPSL